MSRVVRRCPFGYPAVVETLPYDAAGRPFPTLFYATCPTLVAAVERSRAAGGCGVSARRARRGRPGGERSRRRPRYARRRRRDARRRGTACRCATAALRCAPASAASPSRAAALRWRATLKCLHAHAAHALARPGYLLGEAVLAEAGELWCDDRRCAAFVGRRRRRAPGAPPAEPPMKLAVLDLGTNTCRLLLAEVEDGAIVRRDVRETHVVRLGQGVDRTRAARRRGGGAYAPPLADYAAAHRRLSPGAPPARRHQRPARRRRRRRLSRRRRARPRPAVPRRRRGGGGAPRLSRRHGVARASRGARARRREARSPSSTSAAAAPSSPSAAPAQPPRFVRSLDMGAVRITERFFADDPPTPAQWRAAVEFVDGLLARRPARRRARRAPAPSSASPARSRPSSRTSSACASTTRRWSTATPSPSPQIDAAIGLFRALTSAERGRLAGIQKGREDVILAGALIARAACRAFGARGRPRQRGRHPRGHGPLARRRPAAARL